MKKYILGLIGLSLIPFLTGWFTAKPTKEEIKNSNLIKIALLEVKNHPKNYIATGALNSVSIITIRNIYQEQENSNNKPTGRVQFIFKTNRYASSSHFGEKVVIFNPDTCAGRTQQKISYNSELIKLFKTTFIDVQKAEVEITKRLDQKRREAREKNRKQREEKEKAKNPSLDDILKYVEENISSFYSGTKNKDPFIGGNIRVINRWRGLSLNYGTSGWLLGGYRSTTNKAVFSSIRADSTIYVQKSSTKEQVDKFFKLFHTLEAPKILAKQKIEKERSNKIKQYEEELRMVDVASKKAGYAGFSKHNILTLITITQQKGGLEKYLNQTVGNLKNDEHSLKFLYQQIKSIQILENGVLYSYSDFENGKPFHMTIYVEKDPGKIYQEEQSLQDVFYVFTGMFSYISTTGAKKTVPAFRNANLLIKK